MEFSLALPMEFIIALRKMVEIENINGRRKVIFYLCIYLDLGESYCYSIHGCSLPPFRKGFLFIMDFLP